MNDLKLLCEKIKLMDEIDYFDHGSILEKPVYHSDSKLLSLAIETEKTLPLEVLLRFHHRLTKTIQAKVLLTVKPEDQQISNEVRMTYLQHFFHEDIQLDENGRWLIEEENEGIRKAIKNCAQWGVVIETSKIQKSAQLVEQEVKNVVLPASEKVEKTFEDAKKTYVPKNKVQFVPFKLNEIKEACHGVMISGEVFEIEMRQLKNSTLQTVYIADETDAIIMKRFSSAKLSVEELNNLKVGDTINVYGDVENDAFLRDLVIIARRIEVITKPKRADNAPEKRVELHVHTKLSEMDGVSSIAEYVDQAVAWGHEAIAITDHLVVQDFPKAQRYVEKINKKLEKPFKMLYGVEMMMVDPQLNIVKNATDEEIEKVSYCIFDLETTGLSAKYNEIIEFGGVIMEDRDIKKRLQMFVKPKHPIPAKITNLTGISEAMVASARPIEECLDEILDFIGDRVLVAHNATFDVGFLNEVLKKNGREPLKNVIVDTLELARKLHSDRKSHNLGSEARFYNIKYDEVGAHRADYDAAVLAEVYMKMMNDIKQITTFKELANFYDESCFVNVRPSHITVFAKNKAGLKSLFELITISHTQHLAYNGKNTNNVVAEPRIFRREIEERRENLLLGSACANGEVFDKAKTVGDDALAEIIDFYDFIEVQPPENYRFLLEGERSAIPNWENLYEIIQTIIRIGKERGKIVVATGDAHYVEPKQKLIRDIFINSQAIGGKRHPLYIRDPEERRKRTAPDQHFRSTDEMLKCFDFLDQDLAYEIVVTNTKKIADSIDDLKPVYDELFPPDIEDSDKKLAALCYENARKKYGDPLPEIVEARLKRELDSIIGHGFYVVYYISHLLVKKSLEDGYMVGSRGSVGSSFVATMANITEVNPLAPHYVCPKCHYHEFITDGSVASGFDLPDKPCPVCGEIIRGDGQDIPFETFLGFEGDKVPDIDLNFSGDYQANAHNYLKEVFGEDHVFRAGTIATVAEKTAFGYVRGYQEEMGLEGKMRQAQVLRLAKACDGVKRSTGQHPGGILVVPNEFNVHDFTPVQYPANNPFADWKTTHFEFHDIHDNLLKFDILGHVDPTAMKLLEEMSGIDPRTIPMNDPETMKIFSSVESLHIDTTKNTEVTGAAGIPEFGTPFVRGILELTRTTTFDELVRISGLSHGTDVWLNNAKDLIDAGKCTLKNVIGCRDDIMVYLMHKGLPAKLSFTIMESVRKGKGLKPEWEEEMAKYDLDPWYADSCKKIKYMFPKAHAVAYVMMAVRIAWFKVHHPLYYYCMFFSIRCDAYDIDTMIAGENAIRERMNDISSRLNSDAKNEVSKKDKDIYSTLELALEMVLRGYRFSNISLMKSQSKTFIVDKDQKNTIIPPFTSIDGLGESVGNSVVEEREKRPFLSKQDLRERTSLSDTLIKRLEAMGVLDDLQDENQMSLF